MRRMAPSVNGARVLMGRGWEAEGIRSSCFSTRAIVSMATHWFNFNGLSYSRAPSCFFVVVLWDDVSCSVNTTNMMSTYEHHSLKVLGTETAGLHATRGDGDPESCCFIRWICRRTSAAGHKRMLRGGRAEETHWCSKSLSSVHKFRKTFFSF